MKQTPYYWPGSFNHDNRDDVFKVASPNLKNYTWLDYIDVYPMMAITHSEPVLLADGSEAIKIIGDLNLANPDYRTIMMFVGAIKVRKHWVAAFRIAGENEDEEHIYIRAVRGSDPEHRVPSGHNLKDGRRACFMIPIKTTPGQWVGLFQEERG